MDIQISKGESVVLLVTPLDTRGQGWLMTSDIRKVILTIRESETAEALLELYGTVEAIGESVDNPGKLAVLIHTEDTKDLPVGEYWYDVTMIKTGHWFDINEYNGLYVKVDYGKIKDINDNWVEIEEGWIELPDDTVNFLQITKTGEYKITTGDYEKVEGVYVNYNLYRIITVDGAIADVYPYGDWFVEGTHTGLSFVYGAGKVLNSNNELIDVDAGSITLKPNITNYIEVDNTGTVSSNITRFSAGKNPLYKAKTGASDITDVIKQENSFILDDRGIYVRGDSYIPSVKSKVSIIWTPTVISGEE
ncbi:MAG: hypothetical protein BWX89_00095 [candidate division TA06 bacterium ADurb.Bin131]|uniref:Uncharacterized protein n=1 Tax=candidate division TA06 bacterium ADurb.Bin131 TaxID=1852827 RepID=A0A1V6CEI8_UNCT6|nr:MAG: hypothetical protein BWX89_00095 [candidate division TA06 bacterium ADurb.Bin131]